MTKKEFLSLLEETLEADENSLNGKEELEYLDVWDSLGVVSFISMVDEEFDITLSPEDILKAKTVQGLLDMLGDNIQG